MSSEERGTHTKTTLSSSVVTDQQKFIWKKEQETVASLVEVHRDPHLQPGKHNHPVDVDGVGVGVLPEDNSVFRVPLSFHAESVSSLPENNNETQYYYGGVDVSFPNPNKKEGNASIQETEQLFNTESVAVYVILDVRTMQVVYRDHEWYDASRIPYVSTFLAFREIDPLERLIRKQLETCPEKTPAAILVDGNGISHPRRAGIACFVGVRTGIPTIGIGKSLLYIPSCLEGKCGGVDDDGDGDGDPSNAKNNDKRDDFCYWTREKLDTRIDSVLAHVHRKIGAIVNSSSSEGEYTRTRTRTLEEHRGLILSKQPMIGATFPGGRSSSRKGILQDLSRYCNGIAIPLEITSIKNSKGNHEGTRTAIDATSMEANKHRDYDGFGRTLGNAVIGHGRGNNSSNSNGKKNRTKYRCSTGSSKPIIVSVGHKLSLVEATRITVSLCQFRIPEPVRQADLYGRELIRRRKNPHTNSNAISSILL
mmetsp:Transcript_19527/g.40187  ORF Transcript_19527/g.40187 Transcript_19527/m.40187 type:complete len:479 (-) Transcript_19527:125-1561(-)